MSARYSLSLTEKVTFSNELKEKSEGAMGMFGGMFAGRRKSRCKGTEASTWLVYLGTVRSVAGAG